MGYTLDQELLLLACVVTYHAEQPEALKTMPYTGGDGESDWTIYAFAVEQ